MSETLITQVNNKKWAASVSVLLFIVIQALVTTLGALLFGLIGGLQNVPGAVLFVQILTSGLALWFCVRYICSRISASTVFSAQPRTVFRIIVLYIGVIFVLHANAITSDFSDGNFISLLIFAFQIIIDSFLIYYFFQYYRRRFSVQL